MYLGKNDAFVLVNNSLDHALEIVKNEITRLDSSMEKAGEDFC